MFSEDKVYCHLASSRRRPVLPRFCQMAGMLLDLCTERKFFYWRLSLVSFMDLFLRDLFIISLGVFPLGSTKIKLYATFYRDSSSMSKHHQS